MSMGEAIGYIIGALLGLIICLISEIILGKKKIRKLQDKVEMLDFFYEGNGFKKRGLNTAIQIAEYIEKLEKQNKELQEYNKKLLQSNIDQHNKIGFLSRKVQKLQKYNNKAKEIIKNLMEFAEMDNREYEEEYKEAEQFLKESEK